MVLKNATRMDAEVEHDINRVPRHAQSPFAFAIFLFSADWYHFIFSVYVNNVERCKPFASLSSQARFARSTNTKDAISMCKPSVQNPKGFHNRYSLKVVLLLKPNCTKSSLNFDVALVFQLFRLIPFYQKLILVLLLQEHLFFSGFWWIFWTFGSFSLCEVRCMRWVHFWASSIMNNVDRPNNRTTDHVRPCPFIHEDASAYAPRCGQCSSEYDNGSKMGNL